MDVYIYQADLYCDECGRDIKARIDTEGKAPSQEEQAEELYDSNDYPKGPYPDGGGEADCPQFCGAGSECFNTQDGRGAFLENPLTPEGVEYLREMRITRLVMELIDFYRDDLLND